MVKHKRNVMERYVIVYKHTVNIHFVVTVYKMNAYNNTNITS